MASDLVPSKDLKKQRAGEWLEIRGRAAKPLMVALPKSFYEATDEEAIKLLKESVTSWDHHHFEKMDANHKAAEASE